MTTPAGGPEPIANLVEHFHRLPGVGPKSAQRLAYHILRIDDRSAEDLAEAILQVKRRIRLCSVCCHFTEQDPCRYCSDERRDASVVCVVEQPLDIAAIERSGGYRGRYHVLHGILNPIDGIGPEQLRFKELLARIQAGDVTEVIMATNPSLEGEATAMYASRLLTPLGVRVTRLARGLPSGADLEYADDVTLRRAMEGRQAV
jgi:recombination protein RecR